MASLACRTAPYCSSCCHGDPTQKLATTELKHINMASCLVPYLPAVMVAIEHLKELDKLLKEEGVTFAPEASIHLAEITAAVTGLEADRGVAHEHLEVESIENSKLRHQINDIRERISEEIIADVAAARASNAEEIEQLRKDLSAASQLQEEAVKRHQALLSQNQALRPKREQAKDEHEAMVASLNDQITLKYSLQIQLDQTQKLIEELKTCIAAVEQDRKTLLLNMSLEKDAFSVKKDNLSREVDHTEGEIKQQKQAIRRARRELDSVNTKRQETDAYLSELRIHMAKLEGNVQRLSASRCQCEKKLEAEAQNHQALRQQKETLKKELNDLGEAFSLAVQQLKEEIATVEGKIEESRASTQLCQDSLAQIYELYKHQQGEETEVKAEYFQVSEQLERSKLQLEERIASIVRHSKEIKEMDKQIGELVEADTINRRVFNRNQQELSGNVDTENRNIRHLEEEKEQLSKLLEDAKRKQEEHFKKMTSDISNLRRRYEELRQEEDAHLQRQPMSVDADMLMSHVCQSEMEYRQTESMHHQEIEQCSTETEIIMESNKEKQKEVEEKEEILKEVETKWAEEQSRHNKLKALTHKLRTKRSELEQSIQRVKEETSLLLRPKEEKKAELEEARTHYIELLDKQAAELRAVEVSIYNNSVKLEQVNMENSRLHLCISQMTEDVSRAWQHKARCQRDSQQFNQVTKTSCERLREAWRDDLLLTQDCQSSDGVLLVSISSLLNHLKNRSQQLGDVGVLLHQQMLDFSKRLGDKTTA